jgi:hypothetical protein
VLAGVWGRALLVDVDPLGGGLDVVVGVESVAGARWSQLRLSGGTLDAGVLVSGLPAWRDVAVLVADVVPPAGAVEQVLAAAAAVVPVVVDLGRVVSPARSAALERCALVALVTAVDVAGLTAARVVRAGLDAAPVTVIARGARSAAVVAAEAIGAPLAGRLPPLRRRDPSVPNGAGPRAMRRVARGLVAAVPS